MLGVAVVDFNHLVRHDPCCHVLDVPICYPRSVGPAAVLSVQIEGKQDVEVDVD